MDFKQTVLEEGMNIFQEYGIKSLTMEIILERLDISRGTLSEIAKSKEELLEQCIEVTLSQRQVQYANIIEQADNAVEAILSLLRVNLKTIAGHHPDFLSDLRTHHQLCWQKMQAFSQKHLQSYLSQLFTLGKEQQLFRAEINPPLLSNLLIAQTNAIIETGLLNKNAANFDEVFTMGFVYYLRSLVTEKGLAILETRLKKLQPL